MRIACYVVTIKKEGIIFYQEAYTEKQEALDFFIKRLDEDFSDLSGEERQDAVEQEYASYDYDLELRIDYIPA